MGWLRVGEAGLVDFIDFVDSWAALLFFILILLFCLGKFILSSWIGKEMIIFGRFGWLVIKGKSFVNYVLIITNDVYRI